MQMAFWQQDPRVQHCHNESWPLDTISSKFHPTNFHTAYSLKSDSVLFSNFLQILYIIRVKEFYIPDARKIFLFLTFAQYVKLIAAYPFSRPKNSNWLIHGEGCFLRIRWPLRRSTNSTLFKKHRDKL